MRLRIVVCAADIVAVGLHTYIPRKVNGVVANTICRYNVASKYFRSISCYVFTCHGMGTDAVACVKRPILGSKDAFFSKMHFARNDISGQSPRSEDGYRLRFFVTTWPRLGRRRAKDADDEAAAWDLRTE